MSDKTLSDTDEREAILEEGRAEGRAEIRRELTGDITPKPDESSERFHRIARSEARQVLALGLGEHKLDCWSDKGPLGKLKEDVNVIKSWGRGVVVATFILILLNAYSVFFTKNGPVPIPSIGEAHAEGATP